MGQISFYQLLLIFAFGSFVYLIYRRGNRKNKHVISFIVAELEGAINPVKKLYKHLGGTVGYQASYERKGYIHRIEAIFTTLPRQSIAVYPFHLLFGEHDKLQLNIYSEKELSVHAVIVKKQGNYSKLLKKYSVAGLSSKEISDKKDTFLIYYRDEGSLNFSNGLFNEMNMTNVLLLIANPENSLFHIQLIPLENEIEPFVKGFLSNAKKYIVK